MPNQSDVSTTNVASDADVVHVLNELIENCKDGEYGFGKCAEHAKSPQLKQSFTSRAAECQTAATELQDLVVRHGGRPEKSGTVAGSVHRGWLALRGTVALNDDLSMLEECERGEDTAIARYRAALKKDLPPTVQAVVQRQAMGAQRNHDEIKRLRDQLRAQKKS